MLESRSIKLDLFALALFALVVFLGLSLVTYDPADSLDLLSYPPPAHAHNACGRSGALLADVSFQSLGVGAYYLLLSLAVLDGWLLARPAVPDPILGGIGWLPSP